ncbi:MAG: hypothetical protein LLF92_04900 [Planctomycetaceae bacterium]|nr:hypothetical protein [Planctomycetaceae bacterium]
MKKMVMLKNVILFFCLMFVFGNVAKAAMVNDFESYTTNAQLQADWQNPYYSGNGTFTLTLDTTNGIGDSKALKYTYAVGSTADMQHLYTTALGSLDWTNYDRLRFWYRPVGCNAGRTWQAYLNSASGGISSVVTIDNFTTQSNEWHMMEFNLDQNGKSHDINFFIGYFYGLQAGDNGIIYFDNLELFKDQIHESGGSTGVMEKGSGSDSYTVNLEKQPTASVTVTVTPQDTTLDIGNGAGVSKTLTFTTANWDVPQTVTVKSANDVNAAGTKIVAVINHISSDSQSIRSVNVTIWPSECVIENFESYESYIDMDYVWLSGGVWGEGANAIQDLATTISHGGTKSMQYTLSGTPGDAVGFTMSAFQSVDCRMYDYARLWYRGDTSNIAGGTMHFILRDLSSFENLGEEIATNLQSATWQPLTIKFDKSDKWKKIDQVLMGVYPNGATVWYDDIVFYKSPVCITESNDVTEVSEVAASDTYTIRLLYVPTSNVTVTAHTDGQTTVDSGSGAAQTAQVAFTPANYNIAQTITVRAVDDSVLNFDRHSLITHTLVSTDTRYGDCIVPDVNVVIHDNECGAWSYKGGDLNEDCRVNMKDFALLGINWLGTVTETTLQDFESYNDETFANSWEAYYNSTHPSSLVLLTDPAYAQTGQKAAQWSYDLSGALADGKCEVLYTLDAPVDLSQYDEIKVWIKRHAGNSDEHLFYIKFLNNGGMLANIAGESLVYDGATISNPDVWTEWTVDLHNLNYDYASGNGYNSLEDITSMSHILFGIWSSSTLGDMGSGVIDLDEISLGVFLSGDLDKNGKIDFADIANFSDMWLDCTDPQLSGCENLF